MMSERACLSVNKGTMTSTMGQKQHRFYQIFRLSLCREYFASIIDDIEDQDDDEWQIEETGEVLRNAFDLFDE